ncbi:MAG TPA: SDR family NAD(P)-dependent oxidoreductase [Gaiellaceae bacterium]|nr:SDR family NAD(P)-dependent oxidoreductase [Gaiellaceae bacterium]
MSNAPSHPLSGRVALVTGASTGLGRELALALARAGAAVAVNYARSRREAERTAAEARSAGVAAVAVEADVADARTVARMLARVEEELGPVEVLVNNAAVTRYVPLGDVEEVTREDWDRILAVNVVGAYECVRAVVPGMRARGFGRVLNVASTSAFTHDGSSIPYVVSKAALVALTKTLARVLGPEITVNAVAPGWMATPWVERYLPSEVARELHDSAPFVPLEEVTAVALALLAFPATTGQVVCVDRGETIGAPSR